MPKWRTWANISFFIRTNKLQTQLLNKKKFQLECILSYVHLCLFKIFFYYYFIYIFFSFFVFFFVIILHIMFIFIMLWAAGIHGHLSSLVACHCTDLYLFNLFVHLANKLSLSLSLWPTGYIFGKAYTFICVANIGIHCGCGYRASEINSQFRSQ